MPMVNPNYDAVIATSLGRLGLSTFKKGLAGLDFLAPETPERLPVSPVACEAVAQLQAYFSDPRIMFTLPLFPQGTVFQKRIWETLNTIPMGLTVTYGTLASQLKTSARAIGGACRANPLPIFIPCHRVVSKQGLGGYSGAITGPHLDTKIWLLRHEAGSASSKF
ncbi:methylated-DNA--protein-cysteine methyltransferase [Candidatus Nitrosoglobus terrae]|uniref:Methylated-DNA--protein-cysteine methyltransferase n=1 Tax=Candidatus Nitrosoglobus terrae TaxID=1630141 RepID=A0A1Q2SM36_9GAMM|nr:methylated-DNA--[protein]-cysteine S-methyltransferase [Candidatus Nitrosoglobus terrae]BAW80205.1 methylated-DNA--protein-cysteine methyltransferase [Candidatus Nitrosoglobus terrae]